MKNKKRAEEIFSTFFVREMKNKDIDSFKRDYKTLYNKVIIPMVESLISNQENQKMVKCDNCGDVVEMMSTGQCCPHCFC